jgi:hypothetical protein
MYVCVVKLVQIWKSECLRVYCVRVCVCIMCVCVYVLVCVCVCVCAVVYAFLYVRVRMCFVDIYTHTHTHTYTHTTHAQSHCVTLSGVCCSPPFLPLPRLTAVLSTSSRSGRELGVRAGVFRVHHRRAIEILRHPSQSSSHSGATSVG